MPVRELVNYRITIFLSLISISIIAVDRPLAIFIDTHLSALQQTFRNILSGIEFLSAYPISRYIIATLVLVAAIFLYVKDKGINRAKVFFFVGATMISSRLVTAGLKEIFDRNRPFMFVADRSLNDFFGSSDSFPSGHATNYFSFFLPLTILFPRYKWPLLIVPGFIAIQRIVVNDHYLSDVIAGILVATLFTTLFQRVFKISPLQNLPAKP